MLQQIADATLESDWDRAAARVAVFALIACQPDRDRSAPPPETYALLPDNTPLSQDDLVARLARFPKPIWLDGHRVDRLMNVEVGPLETRPLLKRLFEYGQDSRSKRPPDRRPPAPDALILCFTDSNGLRVRRGAFDRYQEDYMLAPPCIYAGGSIEGHYPTGIGLSPSEFEGMAEVIRIVPGGHGEMRIIEILGNE